MSAIRKTLADCRQAEVVELGEAICAGSTDHPIPLEVGAMVQVSWHRPPNAPVTTYVAIYDAAARCFGRPTPMSSRAKVGRLVVERTPAAVDAAGKGGDLVDPLARGMTTLADAPLFDTTTRKP